jgi:hypothetical protein
MLIYIYELQPVLTNGDRFAFASTLAIYQYDGLHCQLQRMLALHQNHITTFSWCPSDAELFAIATKQKVGHAASHSARISCFRMHVCSQPTTLAFSCNIM